MNERTGTDTRAWLPGRRDQRLASSVQMVPDTGLPSFTPPVPHQPGTLR